MRVGLGLAIFGLSLTFTAAAHAAESPSLDSELGRSEVRVYTEAYEVPVGRTVAEVRLVERLERLGYRRIKGKRPEKPGEFFWGDEVFWIYRHAYRRAKGPSRHRK